MANRKARERLEHIGETLNVAFRRQHLDFAQEGASLQGLWLKAAGGIVFAHSRPTKVSNRVLHIKVDNSSWLHQIDMLKGDLLAKITLLPNAPKIDALKLVLGDIPLGSTKGASLESAPLTTKEKRFVEETIVSLPIQDGEFPNNIRRLLTKGIIRRRLLGIDKNH